jgi:pectate lyase
MREFIRSRMLSTVEWLMVGFLAISLVFVGRIQAQAFPGAEGYGALATGGNGGTVYHVTNLNDSGAGSFRDGVSSAHRTVVFNVSGYIRIKSELSVSSDITIDGRSAPGVGVAIFGGPVSFSGATNVIVRSMRFREGLQADQHKSSLMIDNASNMIFDHVSVEWGRWDNIDMNGSTDITFQYSIIGEGINPQRFGCLCQSDFITFSHNLWIDNQDRNPKAKGHIEYINNVVYNWGVTGFEGGHSAADHFIDMINNYFIAGPDSNNSFLGGFTTTDKVFESGNFVDLNKDGVLNGRAVVAADFAQAGAGVLAQPFGNPPVPVTVDSAKAAYSKVVAQAGDSLHRDSVDNSLIGFVTSLGTSGQIIEDPGIPGTLH